MGAGLQAPRGVEIAQGVNVSAAVAHTLYIKL